ncbi:MAG: VWA domain-containing protein [Planctomycetota bacterium]
MKRAARPAVVIPFLLCFSAVAWGGADDAPSLKELTKDLREAVAAGRLTRATDLAGQIGQLGTPAAVDALVQYGINCGMYDLEKSVGGILVGLQGDDSLARIAHHANKNNAFEVRVFLTLVLAKRPETEAFAAVLKNLYDPFVSVTLTAIEATVERGQVAAVDHLVAALEFQEKRGGGGDPLIKFELRKALTTFTAEDFEVADDWRNFWEPRKKNFVRPDGSNRKDALTGVVRKGPKFFEIEVVDAKVLFLLDISGSMDKRDPLPEEQGDPEGGAKSGGTGVDKKEKEKGKKEGGDEPGEIPESRRRLTRVQKELSRVISELPPATEFEIITFNHEVKEFKGKLVSATDGMKQEAIRYVTSLQPAGETHTDEALEKAFNVPSVTSIFLLSDGAPRRNDTLLDVKPILERVRELNRYRRVFLHTVGFEQAGSNLRKFMQQLAKQNRGVYKALR